MRYTDVAIVGGGLAGSTTAAMLGRAGIPAMMIDPHMTYPPDLRCEKLGGTQLPRLRRTGLEEEILRATTIDGEIWEARFGFSVAKKPSDQHGVMYDTLVNAMRAQISPNVEILNTSLIVLANGVSVSLRHLLGLRRRWPMEKSFPRA